jgi:hypothetical protein
MEFNGKYYRLAVIDWRNRPPVMNGWGFVYIHERLEKLSNSVGSGNPRNKQRLAAGAAAPCLCLAGKFKK